MKLYSVCAMLLVATGEASRNLRVADESAGVGLIGGSGGLGPTWTMGDKEAPTGAKDMGGWYASVYTKEQQKRLGVDQFGNTPNVTASNSPSDVNGVTGMVGGSGGIGPDWTMDKDKEAPAGTKDMGGWTAAVYTKEQQDRLGVDEFGNQLGATTSDAPSDVNGVIGMVGGSGGIGPDWTTGEDKEAPAGIKDMGGWTAAVYTKEQQDRLGVDEFGNKPGVTASHGPSDVNGVIGMVGGSGGIGPAWTYDPSVEKPAGTKDMGGWTAAVYTKEQQERLGVDENGHAHTVVVSAI